MKREHDANLALAATARQEAYRAAMVPVYGIELQRKRGKPIRLSVTARAPFTAEELARYRDSYAANFRRDPATLIPVCVVRP
jgi:hypothetical protein